MDGLRWFLSRLRGLTRPRRHVDALDDELRFHLEEEAERLMADGVPADEAAAAARRSLGSPLAVRAHTRDVWTFPRLEQVARDVAYGWRQITKAKLRSAAAIVSLALAVGACLTTFVVMDALLFRPLPVRDAERLHVMLRESHGPDGPPRSFDGVEYPLFLRMRAAISGATLLGVSYAARSDISYGGDQDIEKATVQYVSGDLFTQFGLRPAAGRLLTAADNVAAGAHPVAVISDVYWTRRFGRDPAALGRILRIGASTLRDHRRRRRALHGHRTRRHRRRAAAGCDAPERRGTRIELDAGAGDRRPRGIARRRAGPAAGPGDRLPALSFADLHGHNRGITSATAHRTSPPRPGVVRRVRHAGTLSQRTGRRGAPRGAGVAGRVCERRQSDDRANCSAIPRAGPARVARRGAAQRRPARAGRVRVDCGAGRRARCCVRGGRGAGGRRASERRRQPGVAGVATRPPQHRVRRIADDGGHAALRAGAGAGGASRHASHRIAGRPHTAIASTADARPDDGAGRILRARGLRRRPAGRHARPSGPPATRLRATAPARGAGSGRDAAASRGMGTRRRRHSRTARRGQGRDRRSHARSTAPTGTTSSPSTVRHPRSRVRSSGRWGRTTSRRSACRGGTGETSGRANSTRASRW